MISRWRSPSPRISVCPSSPEYSCWNVGSSSCSLCSPFESFSFSPRCFTSLASVTTGPGRGLLGSPIAGSLLVRVAKGSDVAQRKSSRTGCRSRLPLLPRMLVLERRVLLVHLVQPVRELFPFAALLHFDRLGDHRLGEAELGEHGRVVLVRERVEVKQRGEEEKLSNGLHKLHEE